MPKKHHKNTFAKPVSTPHHTLTTSGPRNSQNDRYRSADSPSGEQPSVNDLINHLRRTQISTSLPDGSHSPARHVVPRSVHPSIRNLLELPETPPPRPRPDARRTGIVGRRLRRTAGPPPPESWLSGVTTAEDIESSDLDATETATVVYRLERLPGREFPGKDSFLHTLLKSMATHWAWHIAYDGQFLGELPTHIKIILLSYVGYYARDQPLMGLMRGLKPLFEISRAVYNDGYDQSVNSDSEVTHLDLSGAVGRWLSLKQLSSELFISKKPSPAETVQNKPVPSSWEDEYDEGSDSRATSRSGVRKTLQGLRFENLRYLSLAHPNPASVNWNSLINLLSRLSTITHLSLAHWPVPTVTPNAINASIRHPMHRSLTFSYGGTDSYSAMENNWAESAGILRKLSRVTYCLKWLDLEGCGDWIPALNWEGVGPQGETYTTGPEWNGSWRDVEWIRLGPGWLPNIDDGDFIPQSAADSISSSAFRSLASSVHAPTSARGGLGEGGPTSTESINSSWDVEVERRKYRLAKELERFRETVCAAKAVQQRVLQIRREGRGKWVHFSFGLEGVAEDVLEKLLGSEFKIGDL